MASLHVSEPLIGRRIFRFDSVTSTNDVARGLALERADEGTVVVSAEQTLGRGSRGRGWLASPGENLLMSVILRPDVPIARASELAFVASVAIANYLIESHGLPVRLKWPNDARVNDNKIAGVLIETVVDAKSGSRAAIVGIGLNVNWRDLPDEIAGSATSVLIETGSETVLEDALQGVIAALGNAYGVYRSDGFDALLAEWMSLECVTGTCVTVLDEAGTIEGRAERIDPDGSLVLRLGDGSLRRISAAGLIVEQH